LSPVARAPRVARLRVTRDRTNRAIFVDQEACVDNVLVRFNITDCKGISTPLPVGASKLLRESPVPISNAERREMALIPYNQAIGSVLYAAASTRPDIAGDQLGIVRPEMFKSKSCWSYERDDLAVKPFGSHVNDVVKCRSA
jgi:hypothetical protein